MGQRILEISTDLLVAILQGLKDGPPRYFTVTQDALPDDVRVVGVGWAGTNYGNGNVVGHDTARLFLESDSWPDAPEDTKVCPMLSVVEASGSATAGGSCRDRPPLL